MEIIGAMIVVYVALRWLQRSEVKQNTRRKFLERSMCSATCAQRRLPPFSADDYPTIEAWLYHERLRVQRTHYELIALRLRLIRWQWDIDHGRSGIEWSTEVTRSIREIANRFPMESMARRELQLRCVGTQRLLAEALGRVLSERREKMRLVQQQLSDLIAILRKVVEEQLESQEHLDALRKIVEEITNPE